jgi:hypothetical protein
LNKKENYMSRTNILVLITVLGVIHGVAWGESGEQERRPDRMGPPPEAIEACKNKSEGDSVSFTTPRGDNIKATCKKLNGQLAAVPEGPPPMGSRPENIRGVQTER